MKIIQIGTKVIIAIGGTQGIITAALVRENFVMYQVTYLLDNKYNEKFFMTCELIIPEESEMEDINIFRKNVL